MLILNLTEKRIKVPLSYIFASLDSKLIIHYRLGETNL